MKLGVTFYGPPGIYIFMRSKKPHHGTRKLNNKKANISGKHKYNYV